MTTPGEIADYLVETYNIMDESEKTRIEIAGILTALLEITPYEICDTISFHDWLSPPIATITDLLIGTERTTDDNTIADGICFDVTEWLQCQMSDPADEGDGHSDLSYDGADEY